MKIRVLLFAFLIFLFFFSLRFMARYYDWDSVIYAYNIISDSWSRVFFNPHHLGFESSGLLFYRGWKVLFGPGNVMFALRIRILLSALIFLYTFWILHQSIYKDWIGTFLLGLGIWCSQAFWFYAQHNDTPLIHSCLLVLLYLYCVKTYYAGLNKKRLLVLFGLQLFTIYFHQTNILFLTFVPAIILLSDKFSEKELSAAGKMRIIFLYLGSLLILIVASYLFVGFVILHRRLDADPSSNFHFSNWLFLYAAMEKWGTSTGPKNYILGFYRGIGDAFLNFQGIRYGLRVDLSNFFSPLAFAYNLNLTFWSGIGLLFLLKIRSFTKQFKVEAVLLFLWLGLAIPFYTWWEGHYMEFWVGVSMALLLWADLTLRSVKLWGAQNTARAIHHLALASFLLLLLSVNFTYSVLPRSQAMKVGYVEGIEKQILQILPETVYRDRPNLNWSEIFVVPEDGEDFFQKARKQRVPEP